MGLFSFRFKGTLDDLTGIPIPEGVEIKQVEDHVRLRMHTDDRNKGLMTMNGLAAVISDKLGLPQPKSYK